MRLVAIVNGAFHQRDVTKVERNLFYKELSKSEEIFEGF